MVWRFFALTFLLGCQFRLAKQELLRVVTWNVGDNAKMKANPDDPKMKDNPEVPGFTNGAIDALLDLDLKDHHQMADIFAVSLQEECWKCNKNDLADIPKAFLKRFDERKIVGYEVVGIQGTLVSDKCDKECKDGNHGTTAVFVIAKKGLVLRHKAFKFVGAHCSDKLDEHKQPKPSEEKGLAAMRLELKDKQSVCVASTHLESRSPQYRRDCLVNFLKDKEANKDFGWDDCTFKFIAGDYNTRTAGAPSEPFVAHLAKKTNNPYTDNLKNHDEMKGAVPFLGGIKTDKLNLLDYINQHQTSVFKESAITFLPTYKMAGDKKTIKEKCGGEILCYKSSHAQSWTDRIIHSEDKTTPKSFRSLKYDAILLMHEQDWSDHIPVFQVFQL